MTTTSDPSPGASPGASQGALPATGQIAYLGPAGTFTEEVVAGRPELARLEPMPLGSMADVLFAVEEGSADIGVVAIENAIEGTVNVAVDTLAFDVELLIQRELVLPVSLHLMALPGTRIQDVDTIRSIPVAWAQCHQWIREHRPDAQMVAASSTAEAARSLTAPPVAGVAAIANRRAAEVYGLEILGEDIEDHPENRTRFAVVARTGIPAPTGHDKTSIVVFQRADAPGSLLSILQEFAARRINLSLLLSRPTKAKLGDYCFLIDLDGHIADEVVADCLRSLRSHQAGLKFLGSYPAAGEPRARSVAEIDDDERAAIRWIEELRSMVER